MQTRSRILDDIARLTNGAAGVASGMRDEIETLVQQRLERVLENLDLVRREEFEAIEAVAIRAREEQEALEKRVAALEKKLDSARAPETGGQGGHKDRHQGKNRGKSRPNLTPERGTPRDLGNRDCPQTRWLRRSAPS